MKVNFERSRILHLVILLAISFIIAQTIMAKTEWTALSAYGFAITITTQINNAIYSNRDDEVDDSADKMRQKKRERMLEKRRERRKGKTGVAVPGTERVSLRD